MKLYCIDLDTLHGDILVSEIIDLIDELQGYTETEKQGEDLYRLRRYIIGEIL